MATLTGNYTGELLPLTPHERVLDPFKVDHDWIGQYIPETIELINQLGATINNGADRQSTYEQQAENLSLSESRSLRRLKARDDVTTNLWAVMVTATNLLFEIEDDTERQNRVHDLIAPNLRRSTTADLIVDGFATEITHLTSLYRNFRQKSCGVTGEITSVIGANRVAQYDLLKLLAQANATSVSQNIEDPTPLDMLLSMVCIDTAERNGDLPIKLYENLQAGIFDKFIAKDLIRYVDGIQPVDMNGLKPLGNMWQLLQNCGAGLSKDLILDRAVAAASYWPSDARLAFSAAKTRLIEKFHTNIQRATGGAISNGYITPKDDLQKAFDMALKGYLESVSMLPNNTGIFSKHEVMRARVEQKKHVGRRALHPLDKIATTNPEATPVHKEVVVVNRVGEQFKKDSHEFSKVISEYLTEHKGNASLELDVERVLAYMGQIDFSAGAIRGIKKYSHTINLGGKNFDVFGFKPLNAVGCSTSSEAAKKIRILFAMIDDNIGIIALTDRAKLSTLERNLDIGTCGGK